VKELILATAFPQHPRNELEYIICDSDLDILGTSRFLEHSLALKKELEENKGKKYTDKEWYENQLSLLKEHKYFTASARALRISMQDANIRKLEILIKEKSSTVNVL
jgi:predicted metal-dependent HD superfamily phosphohydrolase